MDVLTFKALDAVLSICIFAVTVFVIPYLRSLTENTRFSQLEHYVESAVMAVEQTYAAGTGKQKKTEVINAAMAWLSERGLKITAKQLDDLVESAVFAVTEAKKASDADTGATE